MCKKCIVCGNDLTGPSQRKFCSSRCAAIYNNNKRKERNYSTKGRTKIVQCIRCGCNIDVSIHSSRKSWICNECKQNNSPHSKNVEKIKSILEFSKRTAVKILKRMGAKCSICGWDESTCDIHHIIPKKNGGTDNMDNLIYICPNCHRICHTTNKYSIEHLKSLAISILYKDWKNFYHPSNWSFSSNAVLLSDRGPETISASRRSKIGLTWICQIIQAPVVRC